MARSLNKAMLIGNLGADPELRHTASGIEVATFRLATNWSRRTDDGQTEENTEWHNVVAWRRLAQICQQYLTKGSKVYIEGRIQTRSWDDAKTGQKRYMTEIVADQMIMLDQAGAGRGDFGSRVSAAPGPAGGDDRSVDWPDTDDQDDDLPF